MTRHIYQPVETNWVADIINILKSKLWKLHLTQDRVKTNGGHWQFCGKNLRPAEIGSQIVDEW